MDNMEAAMSHVLNLEPDQLRSLIAHAAGLHADKVGVWPTTDALHRIGYTLAEQFSVVRMADIAQHIAFCYGLTLSELRSPSRSRYISHPRQEAMWLMRRVIGRDGRPQYSLPRIATYFRMKDHTSVLHGIRAHEHRVAVGRVREAA